MASLAGDLVIGNFPDPDTPTSTLVPYYATHHAQVLAGGWLLALSGVFFALFGTAVWARIRQAGASPLLTGLTLAGATLTAMTTLEGAGTYGMLGDIGGMHAIAPAALQSWHIMGSDGSLADSAATFIFLLAVAGAGIVARALPRTLAWTALILAVLQLLPGQLGFLSSMIFLLWAAVAGVVLLFSRKASPPATSDQGRAPARPAAASSAAT